MGSGVSMQKSGGYFGTGVALDVPLPFNPKYVKIISVTENAITEMTAEMADATGVQITGATVVARLTADGITLGEGKFTVGVDANINTADSDYIWIAGE